MRQILNVVEAAFTWVAATATLVLMFLTTADGTARYLFSKPIVGAYEITTDFLMIIIVFCGAAYAYNSSAFVRITLLVDRLPKGGQAICNVLSQCISAAVCLLLTLAVGQQTLLMFQDRTSSSGIWRYPLWPAYAVVFVCLGLLTLYLISDVRRSATGRSPLFFDAHRTPDV